MYLYRCVGIYSQDERPNVFEPNLVAVMAVSKPNDPTDYPRLHPYTAKGLEDVIRATQEAIGTGQTKEHTSLKLAILTHAQHQLAEAQKLADLDSGVAREILKTHYTSFMEERTLKAADQLPDPSQHEIKGYLEKFMASDLRLQPRYISWKSLMGRSPADRRVRHVTYQAASLA